MFRFVDAETGEVGRPCTLDDVAYSLEEFYSGDLMNGGGDLVHRPEHVNCEAFCDDEEDESAA